MSAEIMIMIITLGSASMSIVFLFSVMKDSKPDAEKLTKIFGEENMEKIKQTDDEETIKEITRKLSKKQKVKLKTLLESQDIRDVINAIRVHIKGQEPIPKLD